MTTIDQLRQSLRTATGADFVANFVSLCAESQKDLGILSFALILYDESTPEFRKVLADPYYWEALDVASADRLIVFALADRRQTTIPVGGFEYLFKAPRTDGSIGANYSALIARAFKRPLPLTYPAVLFFQVMNDEVHEYRIFELERKDIETSARALQDLLTAIAQVLRGIPKENFRNRQEVFQLVIDDLKRREFRAAIVKGAVALRDVLPFLKLP